MTLEGKVALVTGAGRGLGRAVALHLASLGADVAVLDVDLHSYQQFDAEAAAMTADTTALEVEALGRRCLALEADVTDAEAVSAAVAAIDRAWGRLDVVVCNAGGGQGSPREARASTLDLAELDLVVRRNLYGTVHTCVAAAPVMRRQGSGKIITVSSLAGLRSEPGGSYAHYGVAKAAVAMYTRYLAKDLGPAGITANCVAPGFIGTARLTQVYAASGAVPAPRALARGGTPQDYAQLIGFLAGPASDYITGAVVPLDGGALA